VIHPRRRRRRRVKLPDSFSLCARKFRRSARALPLAVGEGNCHGVLVLRKIRFYCGGNFDEDNGLRFIRIKYSLGLFNGEPRYFTGSKDIEIRS
jgi:hypothetical protein